MQEIANELSIEWDPKALEQKLYTPPLTHVSHALYQFVSSTNWMETSM